MSQHEIYVSTDVETDGPIPGVYSMLSLGSAAFDLDGVLVSTFTVNLELYEGGLQDADTMAFWGRNPEAYAATRVDAHPPHEAMASYHAWLMGLPGKPVFVGYPAGFDFLFVYWYLINFVGHSPFSFSALDVKSYMAGVTGLPYRHCTKRRMPRRWIPDVAHTHVALDDAIEQGHIFMTMLREVRARREPNE